MKKRNLSAKKKIHNFYLKKLNNPKIKKVYSEFEKNLRTNYFKNLAVAISGGSDSMALAFLAKCHSIKNNINYSYFTVDHKLRKESTKEAIQTKIELKKHGIFCKILTLNNNKTYSNIQAKARDARYELIFQNCFKNKAKILLTAHQKNDLYENFFIRLLRGSGLKGLSSFQSEKTIISKNKDIYVLRPLLKISKKNLSYVTKNTFNFNIDDPSNNNDKFLRIKIRKLIKKLSKEGLTFDKFNNTLENLNKSNKVLEFYVKKNIEKNSKFLNNKNSVIVNEIFFQQPEEIVFRSLSLLIHVIGNKKSYTRGKKILSLLNDMNFSGKLKKKTLSGCIFEKVNKSIIISREN